MLVFSNKAANIAGYVEVRLSSEAIHVRGAGNEVGWGVDALVFSRSSRYDELVEFKKLHRFHQREEAEVLLRTVARQYGLTEDVGNAHRKGLFAV